jgi:DNA invertase Pin-like site-specific DNA recombinase
LIGSAAV